MARRKPLLRGWPSLTLKRCEAGGVLVAFLEEPLASCTRALQRAVCLRTSCSTSGLKRSYWWVETVAGSADDERGAGLVDEDGVDLVDDRVVVASLDLLVAAGGHAVVAEVVEAELAVRSIRDVALVLRAAHLRATGRAG